MFVLTTSTTGTLGPSDLCRLYLEYVEPDKLRVSKSVADEPRNRDDEDVGESEPLSFDTDGNLNLEL